MKRPIITVNQKAVINNWLIWCLHLSVINQHNTRWRHALICCNWWNRPVMTSAGRSEHLQMLLPCGPMTASDVWLVCAAVTRWLSGKAPRQQTHANTWVEVRGYLQRGVKTLDISLSLETLLLRHSTILTDRKTLRNKTTKCFTKVKESIQSHRIQKQEIRTIISYIGQTRINI